MMQQMRNHMALAAQLAQGARAECVAAIVKSYDPGTASARVQIQPVDPDNPDRSLTGWLPVVSPWVGNGWGLDAPVSPGDQVEVKFLGGEIENGYIAGRLYSDQQRPTGAQSGEFFLTHASGSLLKFHNDGTVEITAASSMKYTATQHHFVGPVQMDNTLNVNQTISGEGGMTVSGDNGSGHASTVTGNTNFVGTVTANGHAIDDTHRHLNSGGSGLGGVPQ